MAGKFPESYADPLYDQVDAANEQKLGIPVGLLSSIRTAGEKTDASRVSSAGATTPYQFTPATRKAVLDQYGIDVTLSPANASEGAGLLLRDSLKRGGGDEERAVREYHGGTDPKNWGKINDAYAARVLGAHQAAKTDAMGAGFAKFMADNPAVPTTAARGAPVGGPAATQPPATDALSAGFGQWLEQKNNAPAAQVSASQHTPEAQALIDQIPGTMRADGTMPPPVAAPAPQADPTLVQKLIGSGETALTLATGATTGAAGMLAGGVAGAVNNLTNGKYGIPGGVEAGMQQGAESLTYAPRTESGQEQAAAVGGALHAALPAFPLTAELAAIGRGVAPAVAGARDVANAGARQVAAIPAIANSVERIRTAAPAIAERVERILRRNPDPVAPTPGTLASGGSAATDMATQRRQIADEVGVKLTVGQETREQQQLRFEQETAKGENGGKIRERYSDQNAQVERHFDNLVDRTGAEVVDLTEVGRKVDKVLRKELARDKAEVRVKYTTADKSPEALAPVVLDDAVQFLNDSAPDQAVSKVLVAARAHAIKLGIAAEGEAGELVALPTTVKNAETFRRAVGAATDYEPTNIRNSAIIKGSVDTATEALAGPLYRDARRARENLGDKWQNRGVISDLMNNKRGMNDRKVVVEDIFKHIILDSDRAEVGHLRRVLHAGGEEGAQAWKELQGATVNWIKDRAFSNTATDGRGNTILSVSKLESAIKKLEQGKKLDFIFGKAGAQHMRDLVDLSKVIYTTPPGAVNTSNTASVLMAALAEAGVTGGMTGLPVPVLSGLRLISMQVKNRRIQQRIEQALNHRAQPSQPPRPTGATLH